MKQQMASLMSGGAIAAGLMFAGLAMPAYAAPNLVTNGSFELDNFDAGGGYRLGLIGNDVTGWFIPAGDGTYPWGLRNGNVYGAGPADDGQQWLVLGEWGPAVEYTIQQTVTGLNPGGKYRMTWAGASEQGCCSTGELSFLSGSSTAAFDFTAPSSGSYWTQWGHYTYDFTADAASVTFQFENTNPTSNGYDLGLDSVTMTAVPEPAAWALMILGFGAVGTMSRRRARHLGVVTA